MHFLKDSHRERVSEHSFLFLNILKWFVLATVVGVFVGVLSTAFIKCLDMAIKFCLYLGPLTLITPFGFYLSALIVDIWAKSHDAHSTDKVIEYIHALMPVTLISAIKAFVGPIVTIAFGGSAGREAPAADMGAAVGSLTGKLLMMKDVDRRKLMICGVSAGFAAVFGTPVAGALFGAELLFVGSVLYEVLFPAFTAGIIAHQVAGWLGIEHFTTYVRVTQTFDEIYFAKVVLSGVFFGIISILFISLMRGTKRVSSRISIRPLYKAVIAGITLSLIGMFLSDKYMGLGLQTIDNVLRGQNIEWFAPFAKMLTTAVTLNFGGSGGVVTPVMFIGATSGALFASIMGLKVKTFAAIGTVSVLAGTMNTPIAASVMAVELFGAQIAPYAAIACIISYIMTGKNSVYSSQLKQMQKKPQS